MGFLEALGDASTSRVLNLDYIAKANRNNQEYHEKPLFVSPIMNAAFVLKQRMRGNDAYQFESARAMVTKIILPFDPSDLSAGGRSIMVDQRGFQEAVRDVGNYNSDAFAHDVKVMRLINALPSLDPFLLRQHLLNYKIDVAPCYFSISKADQEGMHLFVSNELGRLTKLLGTSASGNSTNRMVSAMLSSDVAEELAPLRETLNLNGEDFRQGVFSWRGFLYYKWSIEKFWPDTILVLKQINEFRPTGLATPEQNTILAQLRRSIIEMVRDNSKHVNQALSVYDRSFGDLVEQQSPKTFRDFLLSAPFMFLELGEKFGAISHMVGFWKRRFASRGCPLVEVDELLTVLQDFASGFGERVKAPSSLIPRPVVMDCRHSR
ncbi:MAG: hypothetical protein H0U98_01480 [Alphaproteobacteria bacterium]|nr:hypothetical protein [Alphaproteobacteria bacterium]